jgi:hypothetical protein
VGVPGTDLNGLDVSGENFASDSNPPAGEESFHLEEDDGVGVPGTDLNGLDVSGENFASDSNPPTCSPSSTPSSTAPHVSVEQT